MSGSLDCFLLEGFLILRTTASGEGVGGGGGGESVI